MSSSPLPALTYAEAEVLERYARVLELLARVNPARTAGTTAACLVSADALVSEARALREALATMVERGEKELFSATLARTLRHLRADERAARLGAGPERSG